MKKQMKRLLLTSLFACLSLFVLASCGNGEDASQEQENDGETVIVAMNVESEPAGGFDPAANWGSVSYTQLEPRKIRRPQHRVGAECRLLR